MLKHALIYPELLQLPLGSLSRFNVLITYSDTKKEGSYIKHFIGFNSIHKETSLKDLPDAYLVSSQTFSCTHLNTLLPNMVYLRNA